MIYNILFAVVGIGLVALGLRMGKFHALFESWREEVLRLMGLVSDLNNKRFEDSCKLVRAFQRIQELEDRLEAHAAELTEHHNKIDTLEINGTVYESLFEQQGLWGEETAEHSDDLEVPEFPDPEDEEIVI